MDKIKQLLQVFRDRSVDPALRGHTSSTQEAFKLAAEELELAIHESEPHNLISFIPMKAIKLVSEAINFDDRSEESWRALGQAAIDLQSGPS